MQQIVDEGIAKPVLVGRKTEIERMCSELSLDLLEHGAVIVDPRLEQNPKYADKLYTLRQRKGLTKFAAASLVQKSDYYASMMVATGDCDGMVTGLRLNYPETVRPPLQIFGLQPNAKVAVGMYMMVLQNSVKFFGDTVFNIDPDADMLANITLQMADAVQGFGIVPRIAMISYSNFGTVAHPEVTKIRRALELVQRARPDLEIDGEMQPEMALDAERRQQYFPFSKLTRNANTLVFSSLAAGNAAYQTLKVLGGASAMGPILLGLSRPVAALQNNVTVEEIVNMTAYVVLKAQQAQRVPIRA